MSELLIFLPWYLLAGALALALLVALVLMGTPGQNPAWALHLEAYLLAAWRTVRHSTHVRRGIWLGFVVGLAVGGTAIAAAWSHNPQGEFHDEDRVAWLALSLVGLSWFVVVFGFVAPAAALLSAAGSWVRARVTGGNSPAA